MSGSNCRITGRCIGVNKRSYHEQADKETDPALIEVVKLNLNDSLERDMLAYLAQLSLGHIVIEGERTPLNLARQLENISQEMTSEILIGMLRPALVIPL